MPSLSQEPCAPLRVTSLRSLFARRPTSPLSALPAILVSTEVALGVTDANYAQAVVRHSSSAVSPPTTAAQQSCSKPVSQPGGNPPLSGGTGGTGGDDEWSLDAALASAQAATRRHFSMRGFVPLLSPGPAAAAVASTAESPLLAVPPPRAVTAVRVGPVSGWRNGGYFNPLRADGGTTRLSRKRTRADPRAVEEKLDALGTAAGEAGTPAGPLLESGNSERVGICRKKVRRKSTRPPVYGKRLHRATAVGGGLRQG